MIKKFVVAAIVAASFSVVAQATEPTPPESEMKQSAVASEAKNDAATSTVKKSVVKKHVVKSKAEKDAVPAPGLA